MRRIIYEVPRSECIQTPVARGLEAAHDGDEPSRRFEDELFERLYDGEMQPLADVDRDVRLAPWATKVHEVCAALPACERLATECRGDADAAGAAVEKLIEELKALNADSAAGAVRSGVRAGAIGASAAVDELREAIAGFWNTSGATSSPFVVCATTRACVESHVLAGRFKRIAATARRRRVHHGADEISDLELGAELGRACVRACALARPEAPAVPASRTSPSAGASTINSSQPSRSAVVR